MRWHEVHGLWVVYRSVAKPGNRARWKGMTSIHVATSRCVSGNIVLANFGSYTHREWGISLSFLFVVAVVLRLFGSRPQRWGLEVERVAYSYRFAVMAIVMLTPGSGGRL